MRAYLHQYKRRVYYKLKLKCHRMKSFTIIVLGLMLLVYSCYFIHSKYSTRSLPLARNNVAVRPVAGFDDWIKVSHVTNTRNIPLVKKSSRNIEMAGKSNNEIWPSKDSYDNDRILNQLSIKPEALNKSENDNGEVPLKSILLYFGKEIWEVDEGRQTFLDQKCAVSTCRLTWTRNEMSTADAVLFRNMPVYERKNVPLEQVWILFMLESPYNTPSLRASNNMFNWTASYRHDADIVAPYAKFALLDENIKTTPQNKNYATGKSKLVAWFVSQCNSRNGRLEYATELAKYVEVDIYGSCGTLKCPRGKPECSEMLNRDYKFYLAFENSNCRDYITEKFFETGLQNDILPIVMGAAPEDYARAAPFHSYIHVDDFDSPEQLANYLHTLDKNDDLYNEYFQWKGTGQFINTYFWCRVCAMLHQKPRDSQTRVSHVYMDFERWWRGNSVCIGRKTWKEIPRSISIKDK